jgi:hypothetical protein
MYFSGPALSMVYDNGFGYAMNEQVFGGVCNMSAPPPQMGVAYFGRPRVQHVHSVHAMNTIST